MNEMQTQTRAISMTNTEKCTHNSQRKWKRTRLAQFPKSVESKSTVIYVSQSIFRNSNKFNLLLATHKHTHTHKSIPKPHWRNSHSLDGLSFDATFLIALPRKKKNWDAPYAVVYWFCYLLWFSRWSINFSSMQNEKKVGSI